MNIQYEVIESYYVNRSSCCGRYDNIQDAIEKLQKMSDDRENMNKTYGIFVKFVEGEKE